MKSISTPLAALLVMAPLSQATPSCALPVSTKTVPNHQLYLQWHNQCLQGNLDTIEKKIKAFEARLATNPNDNLARAYLGSAYALKAKHAFFPLTKLDSLKHAKSLIQTAVKNAPNDPRVRMVRAIAYFRVPKRFDTRPTALADFLYLLERIKNNNCPLQANEKQAVLYYAWRAFTEHNDPHATEAKSLCHQLNPKSSYGKLTQ